MHRNAADLVSIVGSLLSTTARSLNTRNTSESATAKECPV